MSIYVSRPQHVEAVQWTGDNWAEVLPFGGPEAKTASSVHGEVPDATVREPLQLLAGKDGAQGWVPVPVGHWIVHMPDDKSDMWPVDPDYFAAKYEAAPSVQHIDGLVRGGRGDLGSDLAVSGGGSGVRFPSPDDPSLPDQIDGDAC